MKTTTLAQSLNLGNQTIEGPLKNINTLADLVSMALKLIVPLAAVVLLFVLIWGGYDYMMSQGSAEKIKSAQGKITTGLIGFILLILSFFLVRLIAAIFGLGTGIF
jgi:TRAP-type C4-dicarboxylate transport system permease small subunit